MSTLRISKRLSLFYSTNRNSRVLFLSQDVGYPEHRELRKKLKNIWSKHKNFQHVIDEAVKYYS